MTRRNQRKTPQTATRPAAGEFISVRRSEADKGVCEADNQDHTLAGGGMETRGRQAEIVGSSPTLPALSISLRLTTAYT